MKHLIRYIRVKTGFSILEVAKLLLVSILMAGAFYVALAQIPEHLEKSQPEIVDRETKAKMDRHMKDGIACQDWKDRWYFKRDGKT